MVGASFGRMPQCLPKHSDSRLRGLLLRASQAWLSV